MSQSPLSSVSLRNLLRLAERRERLQQELATIEQAIYTKVNQSRLIRPIEKKSVRKLKRAKRGRRGALKGKILEALKAAGSRGIKVTELAERLNVKNQSLHVWFSTTGKTIKGLRRTSPGQYVWAF